MNTTITHAIAAGLLSLGSATALASGCPAEDGPFGQLASFNTYGPLTTAEVADPMAVCETAFRVTLAEVQAAPWNAGFQVLEDAALTDRAGETYTVSFRYRADAARGMVFLLNSRQKGTYGDGGDHTYAYAELQATTEYQTYTTQFKSVRPIGSGETHALYFLAALGTSTTPVYFDDIVIERVPPHHVEPGTWYVAPYGDDANDGTSAASPWRSLPYAFTTLVPGDELVLADGEYYNSGLTMSGLVATAERPTVIRAENPRAAKIIGVDQYGTLLKIEDSEHVLVEGLELTHPGETVDDDWATGIEVFESDYVIVRGNYVHDCGCNGISVRQSDYATVEDNVARGNARTNPYNCSGISVYQPRMRDELPGDHIVIRGNVTYENECRLAFEPLGFTIPTDGNGIILDDYLHTQAFEDKPDYPPFTAGTLIENNLSFGNGGAGVKVFKVPNVTIRHNTVYHNNYVLAEYGSATAEIGFQAVTELAEVYGNVAVKPFAQTSQALAVQSFGKTGSVLSRGNHYVGSTLVDGDLSRVGDVDVSEDVQSYPRFVDATGTPEDDWVVGDFARLFALREDSPLRNAGNAADAPGTDLMGVSRAEGGAPDIGAFEGAKTATGPLPQDATLIAVAPSSPEALRLDGVREGFYTGARYRLMKSIGAATEGPADLDAEWTAAYFGDSLYVFVDVTDDGADAGDAVHVYLDGRADRTPASGEYAAHLTIGRDGVATALAGGLAARGGAAATPNGYRVELALPMSALGVTAADAAELAIEVAAVDADGETGAHRLAWQSTETGEAGAPASLGTLRLRAVTPPVAVGYGAEAAEVDARGDEPAYAAADVHDVAIAVQPGDGGADDLSATWQSYYDATALYFLVTVTDDDLQRDSDNWYEDDGIEIYLDADNSKDFATYGPNDYQLTVAYDGSEVIDRKGQLGPGATAATRITADGYVVEVALPWTAIGATPAAGLFLGVDVHVNDDDGGEGRDGKLTWFAEIDESWSNPALFGTVYLASATVSSVGEAAAVTAVAAAPNPTPDRVTLDLPAGAESFDLRVVDFRGATVLRESGLRSGASVSLGRLPAGVYVLHATSAAGQYRARVVRQ